MKTTGDVMVYIKEHFEYYLTAPEHYASSPEVMEQLLIELDRLRLYSATDSPREDRIMFRGQYFDFLMAYQGGVDSFVGRNQTDDRMKDFAALTAFWRYYLANSHPALIILLTPPKLWG